MVDIKKFADQSGKYISEWLHATHFELEGDKFSKITEPYTMDNKRYQIYCFRSLASYKPDKNKPEAVAFTFYVLRPLDGIKEKFLEELEKRRNQQPHDEKIITDYYMPFVSVFEEFKKLSGALGGMLEVNFYPGKEYKFIMHTTVPTGDYDIAVVYIEAGSVAKLQAANPQELMFDPGN